MNDIMQIRSNMMEFLLFLGALCVTIRFTPKNTEKIREVESYFPVMEGNRVTLYQVMRLSHLIISLVQLVINFMWKCPKCAIIASRTSFPRLVKIDRLDVLKCLIFAPFKFICRMLRRRCCLASRTSQIPTDLLTSRPTAGKIFIKP